MGLRPPAFASRRSEGRHGGKSRNLATFHWRGVHAPATLATSTLMAGPMVELIATFFR